MKHFTLITLLSIAACATEPPTYEEGCAEVAERSCLVFEACLGLPAATCRDDIQRQCLREREPEDEFTSWPECEAALEDLECDDFRYGGWKFSTCYALGEP